MKKQWKTAANLVESSSFLMDSTGFPAVFLYDFWMAVELFFIQIFNSAVETESLMSQNGAVRHYEL